MATFVDTSAIYALLDADDEGHLRVSAVFNDLVRNDPLVTHNYVVLETASLVFRRLGHAMVRALFDGLLRSIRQIWVDEETHARAVTALLADRRSKISLVDRVSFEVMKANYIDRALTLDRDFAAEGFETIP